MNVSRRGKRYGSRAGRLSSLIHAYLPLGHPAGYTLSSPHCLLLLFLQTHWHLHVSLPHPRAKNISPKGLVKLAFHDTRVRKVITAQWTFSEGGPKDALVCLPGVQVLVLKQTVLFIEIQCFLLFCLATRGQCTLKNAKMRMLPCS